MRLTTSSATALVLALPFTTAQTFTDCDPTERSCPANLGLNQANYAADFTRGSDANASWSAAAYTSLDYTSQGAEFTINRAGEAPTVQTDFYFLFGRCDVRMKAAAGRGIVSSIVLESDVLDEIDWEFVGGDAAHVQSNYFGKGNTTTYDRATYIPVEKPLEEFHTYSLDWTPQALSWIIDGTVVRTLKYEDANGGDNYPQTPMQLKLGNWAGGGPGQPEGTVEWAGGETDFSQGPFTMVVQSVSITNYNPAESYEYGDRTGSWESIRVLNGTSSGEGSGGHDAEVSESQGAGASSTVVESVATQPTRTGSVDTSAATIAPTSSHVVEDAARTYVANSVTRTASSVGTATATAQDEGAAGTGGSQGGDAAASTMTSVTVLPGSETTQGADATSSLVEGGMDGSATISAPAVQTDNGAGVVKAWGAGGLIGVAVAALML
ncbi:hypothetical protein MBLNU230_g5289t1 [Neophaeotheca triangularis]